MDTLGSPSACPMYMPFAGNHLRWQSRHRPRSLPRGVDSPIALHRLIVAFIAIVSVFANSAVRADVPQELQAEVEGAAAGLRAFIERMDGKYGKPSSSSNARATIEKLDITKQLADLPVRFRAKNPRSPYQLPDYGREFVVNAGDRVHNIWNASMAYRWPDWNWVEVEVRDLVGNEVKRVSPRDYLQKHVYQLNATAAKISEFVRRGEDVTGVSPDDLRASLLALAEKQKQIEAIFDGPVSQACREVGSLQLAVGRAKSWHLEVLPRRHTRAAIEQALKLHKQAKVALARKSLKIFAPALQQVRSAVATPISISLRAVDVTIVGRSSSEELESVAAGEPFSVLIRFLSPPRDEAIAVQMTSPSDRQRTVVARRVAGEAGVYRADGLMVQLSGDEADGKALRASPGDTIGARLDDGGHDTVAIRPSCEQLRADIDAAERALAALEKQAADLAKLIKGDEAEMARALNRIKAKEEQTGNLERKKRIVDAELDRLDHTLKEMARARGELLSGLPKAARYNLALELYDVRESSERPLTEAEQRDFMYVAGAPGGTFDAVVMEAKRSNFARFAWGLGQVAKIAMNLEPQPGGVPGAGEVWQVWGEHVFKVRDPGELGDAEFLDSDPSFKKTISFPGSMATLQGEAKQAYDELVGTLRDIDKKKQGGADDAALKDELGKVNTLVVNFLKHLKGATDALTEQQTKLKKISEDYEQKLEAVDMPKLRAAYEYLETFLAERRRTHEALLSEIEALRAKLDAMREMQAKHCGGK